MMPNSSEQKGSALTMAIFVMAMLSLLGIALIGMAEVNVKMNKAALNSKSAFYLAEAGVEHGRRLLYDINVGADVFEPQLVNFAGANGVIDFDPHQIRVQYDAQGRVTGVTGFGDDAPLVGKSDLGEGLFFAFLTNDPIDGRTNLADTNSRVMITGIGVGPNQSFKIVESIVEPEELLPPVPPSAITLIGSDPLFNGGSSNAERYNGADCHFLGGGIPDLNVSIVGTTSPEAEADAESGMLGNLSKYTSGDFTGYETGVDLLNASDPLVIETGLGPMDPLWADCGFLQNLLESMDEHATFYCDGGVSCSLPENPTAEDIMFVDGDMTIDANYEGTGVLVVTGELEILGTAGWSGIILAIGEGQVIRRGGGNGIVSGSTIVANIAGPNGIYGDEDDCQGVPATSDDGSVPPPDPDLFGSAAYEVMGGGNADIDFCSRFTAPGTRAYHVVDFRQL